MSKEKFIDKWGVFIFSTLMVALGLYMIVSMPIDNQEKNADIEELRFTHTTYGSPSIAIQIEDSEEWAYIKRQSEDEILEPNLAVAPAELVIWGFPTYRCPVCGFETNQPYTFGYLSTTTDPSISKNFCPRCLLEWWAEYIPEMEELTCQKH